MAVADRVSMPRRGLRGLSPSQPAPIEPSRQPTQGNLLPLEANYPSSRDFERRVAEFIEQHEGRGVAAEAQHGPRLGGLITVLGVRVPFDTILKIHDACRVGRTTSRRSENCFIAFIDEHDRRLVIKNTDDRPYLVIGIG